MKYYILGSGLPAHEIEIARLLKVDIALAERNRVITVLYPISEEAKQKLGRLGLRDMESEIHMPAYFVIIKIDDAILFLKIKYGLDLEPINTQKTSP